MENAIIKFMRARNMKGLFQRIDQHNLDNSPFPLVASKIVRKDVRHDFQIFLNRVYKNVESKLVPPVKNYLAIYIMNAEEETDENKHCIECSREVIKWLNVLRFMANRDRYDNEIYTNFTKSVYDFLHEFECWKRDDLEKMIGALCMSYYEIMNMKNQVINDYNLKKQQKKENDNSEELDDLNEALTPDSDKEGDPSQVRDNGEGSSTGEEPEPNDPDRFYMEMMSKEFDNQMTEIRKALGKITDKPDFHIKEFGKGVKNVAVSNDIKDVMERAYWDKIKEEINGETPNYNTVIALFDEIGEMLKALTPNKAEHRETISRVLDKDYIQYLSDQNLMNREELERLFLFVLNKIQSYESPVRNIETKFVIKEFNRKIKSRHSNLSDIIVETFKIVYDKVNQIYDDMVNAANMFNQDN